MVSVSIPFIVYPRPGPRKRVDALSAPSGMPCQSLCPGFFPSCPWSPLPRAWTVRRARWRVWPSRAEMAALRKRKTARLPPSFLRGGSRAVGVLCVRRVTGPGARPGFRRSGRWRPLSLPGSGPPAWSARSWGRAPRSGARQRRKASAWWWSTAPRTSSAP